jgi:hypothetical protein
MTLINEYFVHETVGGIFKLLLLIVVVVLLLLLLLGYY